MSTCNESTPEPYRLRSYQAEMVELSMRANIIVVMDTGSGKTHIAIERTRAELEICRPDQLIWFLAPTVALCEQQHETFKTNLPGYGVQTISGKDGVDHWTNQGDWDAVLANVRIVITTHQVLLDALSHAFVKMSKLALLIFDEAHHATSNHPANRIMSNFYKNRIMEDYDTLPKILGLSASPVIKAKGTTHALQQIEHNLHAAVRTPTLHRSELLRYVHKPELLQVNYQVGNANHTHSHALLALERSFITYDILQDPFVINLLMQQDGGHDTSEQLARVFERRKTYCSEQLRILFLKAKAMSEELGSSAMEWYLHQCKVRFEELVHSSGRQLLDLSMNEKQHLLRFLRNLPCPQSPPFPRISLDRLSPKVEALINTLVLEAREDTEFTGLVFVEQRIWVAALAEILSAHPKTKNLFRIGTFVGASHFIKSNVSIATFTEPRNQQSTLDDFRTGSLNLILATSVLEEGIDISSCHLVICFERPKNLKSFVQRRGRARRQKSKYLIFNPGLEAERSPQSWQALEDGMRAAYLDDMRQVKLAEERELQNDDGERFFEVPSTGALLTLDNASQHLYHFCALLASGPYVDVRPQFSFKEVPPGKIIAEVMLPISVDPAVRTAKSDLSWYTERMAKKDAAFVAYKGLYLAGLVNENLLHSLTESNDQAGDFQTHDYRPSRIPVPPPFDPWLSFAQCQQKTPQTYFKTLVQLTTKEGEELEAVRMLLLTPISFPMIPNFILHWNKTKKYKVRPSGVSWDTFTPEVIQTMREITREVFRSVHRSRMQEPRFDFLCMLVPCNMHGQIPDHAGLQQWKDSISGREFVSQRLREERYDITNWGLVTLQGDRRKYIPKSLNIAAFQKTSEENKPSLRVLLLPKRRNFFHSIVHEHNVNDAHTKIEDLDATDCVVENLPAAYAVFALLFPSILHKMEVYVMAETLRVTILRPVAFDQSHLPILTTALTSSAASENENYQRLEFLGDCILKLITSLHLMADNLNWPESYLTGKKSKIVSNGSLARASLAAGLDRFIIFERITGSKWSPRFAEDVLTNTKSLDRTYRSSKLIADVIESLIGASYVVGGISKACLCIKALLLLEPWMTALQANTILYEAAPTECAITGLGGLEALVRHTFSRKMLLLEALTHASFNGANVRCSYERLEFLGDAVLDYVVSRRLYAHEPLVSHQTMHTVRTAMVNASFLAFQMFEATDLEEITDKTTMKPQKQQRALWQYLRVSGYQIITAREAALKQHEQAREQVTAALAHDARYPWHLLAATDPPKFLSDIVESVIGAIYIDTKGDIPSCEGFVRRLGILDCLDRILRDGVDCLHPKERLGHLAVDKDVQYVRVSESEDRSVRGDNMYRCQVKMGNEDVGSVVEGLKKLNAETIAAFHSVAIIERAINRKISKAKGEEKDVFFDAEEGGAAMVVG
ncbi:dicer-like protein 2 [Phaeosphaeriaceae sp. PMI808]|nr:dicer-like protein 2 [Phaeosphaeriaceae sp. PMI808]